MARKIGAQARRIQNLSRAINKIGVENIQKTFALDYKVTDIKPGINDISFKIDGKNMTVRYADLPNLSKSQQSSIVKALSVERYTERQKKAFQDLKEKGKISKSFERTIAKDNPQLLSDINNFNDVADDFDLENVDFKSDIDALAEASEYLEEDSSHKFDFFNVHGKKDGFSQLNAFTWSLYKAKRTGDKIVN